MEIGNKIKQLRYKAEFTQEQLAEKLGIGAQSVSKWENGNSCPDISLLPQIAEVFGVTIDDLFDLTVEQRFNRIENRLDVEEDLAQDIFWEYDEFLKSQLANEKYKKRATDLLAYLYWHRMNAAAENVKRYAKDSIRMSPDEKNCQWMLDVASNNAIWDWNIANHSKGVDFYREVCEENPDALLPMYYLMDNLLADNRADEAEILLERMSQHKKAKPVLITVYKAHIALSRYDIKSADKTIEDMVEANPDNSDALFEAAQYYAKKCNYERAIELYEKSYEKTTRKPKFTDELVGIADIYQIMGDYKKAAETYDRIIDSMRNEWHMTEDTELKKAERKKAELLEMINRQ